MGTNNRARRAAKAKKKRQDQSRRRQQQQQATRRQGQAGTTNQATTDPDVHTDGELIMAGASAEHQRDTKSLDAVIAVLSDRPRRRVGAALSTMLELQVSWVWGGGWQPADIIRSARKEYGAGPAELLRHAIAVDSASYERWGRRVAPGWMAQLEMIGATRDSVDGQRWIFGLDEEWTTVLRWGIELLNFLRHVPEIPTLTPPPSAWNRASSPPAGVNAADISPVVLDRVRRLLAKAESTQFEAEAEALTAKAQELITRHRIDRSTVGPDPEPSSECIGRRLGMDNPYPEARAALLAGVAAANDCRAVWSRNLGFSTVFGTADDIALVEELYTSLQVQASRALIQEGAKHDRFGRSRTTRFRRSFLASFATRISHRLRDATSETIRTVENETGRAIVPVFDAKKRAADRAFEATYPDSGGFSVSISDREGQLAGARLAQTVDLSTSADVDTDQSTKAVAERSASVA